MTVALAVRRIAPGLLAEARAACSALAIPTEDWGGGIPRHPPRVVITSLEIGDRRIPEDVCGLLDATPGVRAIVCASEPLIKPRIDLADGRVTLLSAPIDRSRLVAVLRNALDLGTPTSTPDATRRFEVLRRAYWVAWTRGAEAVPLHLDESTGTTVMFGNGEVKDAARVIASDLDDTRLSAELSGMLGLEQAVVHLSADAAEWRVYWPHREAPLWLCSPHRMPARWQLHTTLSNNQRFLRVSGFPGDQFIAGWSAKTIPRDVFAPVGDVVAEGGPSTIGVLQSITALLSSLGVAVVEVR